MSISRKEFIKQMALLAGTTVLPHRAIQKAFAIDPEPGTTYKDAEHVIFLMQENRSFDHCLGSLRGVRGFNDPRAINLPNGNPVWFQSDERGKTYAPFRLDLKDSKATWMSGLPHSWTDQVDARNNGKYDAWLKAKKSGNKDYADMPLTLGYYNRQDIPFYYELADAFTVCDQHFCSSLTGTSPNRLYFWTGTVRGEQHPGSKPHIQNGDIDYKDLNWKTFPERLEENGVSWKVYQNELSIPVGFEGEEDDWLANFTDNDLEYFSQYHVRLHKEHLQYLEKRTNQLEQEINQIKDGIQAGDSGLKDKLQKKREELDKLRAYRKKWNKKRLNNLSEFEKSIHQRAFTTNRTDPDYHQLKQLAYEYDDKQHEMKAPKGDVLHQFRKDVQSGNLPAVSWMVAPQNFSDHPSAPWYGIWYVSEVMNILTQNPEVWKKTIFVLTYDENDGYFDHVPPFVAPNPNKPKTGATSKGIDAGVEFATNQQLKKRDDYSPERYPESSIGLGYRVPMIVVSPWSRGGWVNSQVLDHSSNLQFLEKFLSNKTGREIREPQISDWRRAVCGDLTSVFRPYNGEKLTMPDSIEQDEYLETVNKAQYKNLPEGYKSFSGQQLEQIKKHPELLRQVIRQEEGQRPSCALPYQLYVEGGINEDNDAFEINFAASNKVFEDEAAGSAFNVYAPVSFGDPANGKPETLRSWAYAVKAGEEVQDEWPLQHFEKGRYHLEVYGPNGFFRRFEGNADDPDLTLRLEYESDENNEHKLTGNVVLTVQNKSQKQYPIIIEDLAYGQKRKEKVVEPESSANIPLDLQRSSGWYDFSVQVKGASNFERGYAGRVETGKPGISDPQLS